MTSANEAMRELKQQLTSAIQQNRKDFRWLEDGVECNSFRWLGQSERIYARSLVAVAAVSVNCKDCCDRIYESLKSQPFYYRQDTDLLLNLSIYNNVYMLCAVIGDVPKLKELDKKDWFFTDGLIPDRYKSDKFLGCGFVDLIDNIGK